MDDVPDVIRVEKLLFTPTQDQNHGQNQEGHWDKPTETRQRSIPDVSTEASNGGGGGAVDTRPWTFDASIQFAVEASSVKIPLTYDVDFVSAYPCYGGPHVLFWDFAYRAVKLDAGLLDITDWASERTTTRPTSTSSMTGWQRSDPLHGSASGTCAPAVPVRVPDASPSKAPPLAATPTPTSTPRPVLEALERVLVIEALGVSDNEVFARAWCAARGLNALVADVTVTCWACAVREAFAAGLSVVLVICKGGGRAG
ncbi:hypothetical protein LTS18_010370 [Coniosporium uncinatum]|uniref:Uncharacterized protein n=1 Tax=Coniosporium uncinatum TaxID=93489 RepID=A0ACC3DL21_9PEZI|nr:hypothetical protein LTS18_010370 [Coniosporium uncinatum]